MPCRYSRSFTFLLICSALFASAARPLSSPVPVEDSSALTKCTDNEKGSHSYFWTVQHPSINGTVHLFGYFRVAANLIWDFVSPEAKRRFSASNVVVFESDNEGIEQLAECIRQQKINETEQLSASLWKRLDGYLNRSKEQSPIPGVQWGQVSTEWLLPFLLHVLSHRELSSVAKEDEIDLKLKKQAIEQSKQLEFIEHVPELCHYLPSFSHPQLESAVEHLLDELEMTEEKGVDLQQGSTRRAVMLYGCGELEPADDLIGQSFLSPNARLRTEELKGLNQMLLFDIVTLRNKRWINKIVRLMEENSQKHIFFAFGSSHLLGEGSIVQLLRERGFVVVEQQLANKSADPGERSGQTENRTTKSASDRLSGSNSLWVIFGVLATIPCFIALFLIIRCLRIEAEPKDEKKLNGNGKRRPSIKLVVQQLSNSTNDHFANNVTVSGGNDTVSGGNDTVSGGNDTVSEDKNDHLANNEALPNAINDHFANNDTLFGGNDTVSGGNDTLSNGTNGHFANNVTVSGSNDTVSNGNDTVSEGKNDHLANNETLPNGTNGHFANNVTVFGSNYTVSGGNDNVSGGNDTVSGGDDTVYGGNDTVSNGTNGHFVNNETVSGGNNTVSEDKNDHLANNEALSNGTNHFANDVTVSGGNDTVSNGNDTVSEDKNDHLANNEALSNGTNRHFSYDVTVSGGNVTVSGGNVTVSDGNDTVFNGNDTVSEDKNDHFQLSYVSMD